MLNFRCINKYIIISIMVAMLWRHVVIKSDNHPGLMVYKLETSAGRINTFAWSFLMLMQNLKVKCSVKSGRIVAYKNTQTFSHDN